jgi:HEAT repeat protein
MPSRSRLAFFPVPLLIATTFIAACSNGNEEQLIESRSRENSAVIAWANRFHAQADEWLRGDKKSPFPSWDESRWNEWVAEGRAISNVEDALLRLIAQKDHRIHREVLVEALGVVGTAKSIPVLVEMTRECTSGIEPYAVAALARIGLPECAAPLANTLFYSGDTNCRRGAANSLVQINPPDIEDILGRKLEEIRKEEREVESLLLQAQKKQNRP